MKRTLTSFFLFAITGCTPTMDEVAYYAKSQYDCPADKIVVVGGDEYEACGFRFRSRCTTGLMGGGSCSFEASEEMAGENRDRQLGLFAQQELQCSEDDVVVKVDKDAVLDIGGAKLREGERALVGTGCGKTMHWVCPAKGDAKSTSTCRRVPEEDLQWRSASRLILDDFKCSDKLDIERVTVDSATRVLHEGQLVVAVIAHCRRETSERDRSETTQGYRCPVTNDKVDSCTRAEPGPELGTSFDAAAQQWASTVKTTAQKLKVRHGRPQYDGQLSWRRWTEVTSSAGEGAYIRCSDVLLGPAKPECRVMRPERISDPIGRARETCEADGRCKSGTNGYLRGSEGLASFIDLRTGPAEVVPYRCIYGVAEGRYECKLDENAVKSFAAAKQNARKTFSIGERAACPKNDVSLALSSNSKGTRTWPFEVKGCGQTASISCSDDAGTCSDAPP